MGFGSFLGKAERWLKKAAKSVIEDKTVRSIANKAVSTLESVGSFAGKEVDKIVTATTGLVNHTGNAIEDVGKGVGKGVEGIGNSAMYLGIGAAVIGGIYLMSNSGKGTKREFRRVSPSDGATLRNCNSCPQGLAKRQKLKM